MSKLKIAVIGCGGIANQKHFPALKNNADLGEIVSFCDIRIERAEAAAKEYGAQGAQVTADYKEVLANPDVEVVHICTPNVSHSEIAIMYTARNPCPTARKRRRRWWMRGRSRECSLR